MLLRAGDAQVVLDPYQGGAIRAYTCRGRDILRATPESAAEPLEFSCFPLVPFANRIATGRFTTSGQTVRLHPNWAADPHPIHGQGWRGHWRIRAATAAEASLQFDGGGDDWPWRYRAEQRFELAASALVVSLAVENLSATPMPAILGLHPYFTDLQHASLRAHLPRMWRIDAAALPLEEIATPAEYSFEARRPVGAVALDHCFGGWDGAAELRWPDRTLTLRADNCRFLQLYAPPVGDFFCLEPQTAATGAISRGQAPLLEPGESLSMRLRLECGES